MKIHEYDEDISQIIKFKTDHLNYWYGIELEVEKTVTDDLDDEIEDRGNDEVLEELPELDKLGKAMPVKGILKHDGSLIFGLEFVTIPAKFEDHIGKWDNFLEMLKKEGFTSFKGDTCGIHIHVNKSALTPFQVAKILTFIYNPENRRFVRYIAQRISERYAEFSSKKGGKYIKDNYHSGEHSDNRYTAVNIENTNTIEFRLFRGNLHPPSFYKNIEFVDALLYFTRSCRYSLIQCSCYKNFIQFVIENKKKYTHLHDFIEKVVLPRINKTSKADLIEEEEEEEDKSEAILVDQLEEQYTNSSDNFIF